MTARIWCARPAGQLEVFMYAKTGGRDNSVAFAKIPASGTAGHADERRNAACFGGEPMVWDSDKQSRGSADSSLKGQDGQTSVNGTYAVRISHIRASHRDGCNRGYGWWWWRLMPALGSHESSCGAAVSARNQFGESVETTTDYPQWATREDCSAKQDKEDSGRSTHASHTRAYLIRYRAELADAITSEISVLDGTLTLDCTNIVEATRLGERRKFLLIEAIGEVV